MSKVITRQVCSIILDELYHNARKEPIDQISTDELRKRCKVSINTLFTFRNILINRKLLLVIGKGRGSKTEWNKSRCAMNSALMKSVYDEYINNQRTRKVKEVKPKVTKITLDSVLQYLVKQGYTGIISKSVNDYTIESIDLSKIISK